MMDLHFFICLYNNLLTLLNEKQFITINVPASYYNGSSRSTDRDGDGTPPVMRRQINAGKAKPEDVSFAHEECHTLGYGYDAHGEVCALSSVPGKVLDMVKYAGDHYGRITTNSSGSSKGGMTEV